VARRFKHKKNSDIALVPQPSDNINDPLNWPKWKKIAAFIPIVTFAAVTNWAVAGPGTAIVIIMEEYGLELNQTVNGVINWVVLTLGLAVHVFHDISS
jgi:hypothetical protein